VNVVIFYGGLGRRIRDASEHVPKPMVVIGYRPILWHVMKYYAPFWAQGFWVVSWV
jgi:glucose-1-phosphate cytidylyltransferase